MRIVQGTGYYFDLDESASRGLLDDLLSRPLFAHLATASEQGPHESPVWFLWEDEAIWMIGSYQTDTFPKRIEQEPCCAIGIVDFDISTGLVYHVGFRGKVHLEPHDEARVKWLLSRYLGEQEQWDPQFVGVVGDMDYVLVRFDPETAVVRNPSYRVKKMPASNY